MEPQRWQPYGRSPRLSFRDHHGLQTPCEVVVFWMHCILGFKHTVQKNYINWWYTFKFGCPRRSCWGIHELRKVGWTCTIVPWEKIEACSNKLEKTHPTSKRYCQVIQAFPRSTSKPPKLDDFSNRTGNLNSSIFLALIIHPKTFIPRFLKVSTKTWIFSAGICSGLRAEPKETRTAPSEMESINITITILPGIGKF